MTVLAAKRDLSKSEYIEALEELQELTYTTYNNIPKNKQKLLGDPIVAIVNDVYSQIYEVRQDYFTKHITYERNAELIRGIIMKLLSLEKLLWPMWNVTKCETKKMVRWVDVISSVIYHIGRLAGLNVDKNTKYIRIIDYTAMKDVKFISNMRKLHKYIYTKVVHIPSAFRATNGNLILKLADDALCHVIQANAIYPNTSKKYQIRTKHFQDALTCLMSMLQPTYYTFAFMNYSETILKEWTGMLTEEVKMIKSIIKSDKNRFKDII